MPKQRRSFLDWFKPRTKGRRGSKGKTCTKGDTLPVVLPDGLEYTNPREGLRALAALMKDYYMGRTKSEMTKVILYSMQQAQGFLKLMIEAEELAVKKEQLLLDKQVHSTIEKLLEQGDGK